MLLLILLLSLVAPIITVITVIMIGIIPVRHLPIIPVGQPRKSQFMTHVLQGGACLMVEVMVYGQRQGLLILHTMAAGYLSVSVLLQQHGILLRVLAATPAAVSALSEASATIGLLLLTITARTACASATMAASFRRTTTIARTVSLSVVSKNQNNLISVVRKPKRKQGFHDHAFQSIPLVLGTRNSSTFNSSNL